MQFALGLDGVGRTAYPAWEVCPCDDAAALGHVSGQVDRCRRGEAEGLLDARLEVRETA